MPTDKPRISITLDASDLAVLDRYATASGTPRATMLAALVRATVPELQRAAELIELANAAPRRVVQGVVDDLANATADAMGFLEPFNADYHRVLGCLQGELALERPVRRTVKPGTGVPAQRADRSGQSAPRGKPPRKPGPSDPHLLTGGSK